MTRANTEQAKFVPWFAKAGAACSIVPIARFIGPNIFALKGGGYGCLFALTGIDEEGLTDQELESRVRSIEGGLRGLPEGACLYQYTRVMSGYELPRQETYSNPVTQVFVDDRLTFLERTAGFRRIDLHWCLTLEPSRLKAFERKPPQNSGDTSRMLAELQKSATILEGHLSSLLGLRMLDKNSTFQFFSHLFNLEEWAAKSQLRDDSGVDRQLVSSPVAWHSDHLRVGKRYVQMFSLKTTPEASRPCLFSGLMTLDCDSVLCSTWQPKSSTAARHEIDAQEKFISFFKVGVLTRVMSGRDTASLETGAGAKAANSSVDDLSLVIRELDKKGQGEPAPQETYEEAEQRRLEHQQRMAAYQAEQQRKEEERQAEFDRQQKEYEAEVKRREEQHKARLERLEQIVAGAPIMFSANQLRAFLRLLLNVSPYGLFEEVAEQIAGQINEHDKTEDEILIAELASQPDDKLTGFALRLVLTDHVSIPREGETDWLAEAEAVFTAPQPKPQAQKKGSKKPALVQSPAKKPAGKKKTAA